MAYVKKNNVTMEQRLVAILRQHPEGLTVARVYDLVLEQFHGTRAGLAAVFSHMVYKGKVENIGGFKCECCGRVSVKYKAVEPVLNKK